MRAAAKSRPGLHPVEQLIADSGETDEPVLMLISKSHWDLICAAAAEDGVLPGHVLGAALTRYLEARPGKR